MKIHHIILLFAVLFLLLCVTNYRAVSRLWSPVHARISATPLPAATDNGDSCWCTMRLPALGRDFNIFVLAAIGFAVGIFGRLLGMVGTWIVTPALNIFGFPMAMAVGTDLTQMTGTSYVTTFKYGMRGDAGFKLVFLFIVGIAIGIELGAHTLLWLSKMNLAGTVIRIAYLVVLVGLALFMIIDYRRETGAQHGRPPAGPAWSLPPEGGTAISRKLQATRLPPMVTLSASGVRVSVWVLLLIVMMTGWLFGLLGVVGGFLPMPAMIYLMGILPATAVGIDLRTKVFSGTYGCLTYALKGQVDIIAVLWILLGAIVGMQICARTACYVRGHSVQLLFAITAIIVGLSLVMKQFNVIGPARVAFLVAILAACVFIVAEMLRGWIRNRQA